MAMKTYTFTGYAQTVVNQNDMAYRGKRNDWDNPKNAQGDNDNTYAKGYYTKEKSTYKKPHRVYAYDFGCDVPSEAVIKSIKFEVSMRHTGKLDVICPSGTYMFYEHDVSATASAPDKTGWYNGAYRYVPTKRKISENYVDVPYTISTSNLKKYSNLNRMLGMQVFGIVLGFNDAKTTGQVRIRWVKLTVEYYLPQRVTTFDNVSIDSDSPTEININSLVAINLTSQNISVASENDRTYVIDLPIGFELAYSESSGNTISFDESTMEWKVSGKGNTKSKLTMYVTVKASGLKEIRLFDDMGTPKRGYFFVDSDRIVGFDEIICTPHDLRRGELSCIDFAVRSQSTSTQYGFTVFIPALDGLLDVYSVELIGGNTSENVSLNDIYHDDDFVDVVLTVPANEEFYVGIKICYYPRESGKQTINVQTSNLRKDFTVDISDAYQKTIRFNTEEDGSCSQIIEVVNDRFITQVEGDLDVIPIFHRRL